ncbi:ferredoxin [Alteribacillus persepolensis]|uniref:Ferredoxin n=1 Tax=Alteribacillus persepolensis TaxID=568899 RepID=A0A1G8A620_9BACI|nr:ferredoxin [Alteribacillus persepolensis]SDH15830.1 ferredoxin [Alteribacillus persepolensis]
MSKFVFVDKDTCIACGACGEDAPNIFEYDEEGLSEVALDNNTGTGAVPEDLEEELLDAEEGCPTESIKVADTPFQNKAANE